METERGNNRITLSIAKPTNQMLEEVQHYLRRNGSRWYKAEIIHEAVTHFAQGLGLDHANDGDTSAEDDQPSLDFCPEGDFVKDADTSSEARAAVGEAAGLG